MCLGNVESAAVLFYLAGDRRLVSQTGLFMIHAVGFSCPNLITKAALGPFTENLSNDLQRYGHIFKERTKGAHIAFDIDQCLCQGERWINAAEAFQLGLATVPPAEHKAPKGAIWRHLA